MTISKSFKMALLSIILIAYFVVIIGYNMTLDNSAEFFISNFRLTAEGFATKFRMMLI